MLTHWGRVGKKGFMQGPSAPISSTSLSRCELGREIRYGETQRERFCRWCWLCDRLQGETAKEITAEILAELSLRYPHGIDLRSNEREGRWLGGREGGRVIRYSRRLPLLEPSRERCRRPPRPNARRSRGSPLSLFLFARPLSSNNQMWSLQIRGKLRRYLLLPPSLPSQSVRLLQSQSWS